MGRVVSGYYKLCVWLMRLAYLNLLWLFFIVIGLGIFGVFPATVAMFSVVRQWLNGNKEIAIFKEFLQVYRTEFFKINGLGWGLAIIGYVLFISFEILTLQESFIYNFASLGFISIFIMYVMVVMYFFPIYVHFDLKLREYFVWPLIIGVFHPILTIAIVAGFAGVIYLIFITAPGVFIVFGGSIGAYALMWASIPAFRKYEDYRGIGQAE